MLLSGNGKEEDQFESVQNLDVFFSRMYRYYYYKVASFQYLFQLC